MMTWNALRGQPVRVLVVDDEAPICRAVSLALQQAAYDVSTARSGETAYSLLNDSFQQILTEFARLIEPKIEIHQLFPNFRTKLDQSMILREKLWYVLQGVRAAEKEADEKQMRELQNRTEEFLGEAVHFLFYKDKESVERFVEEIFVTNEKQDLKGILHRFATYLETLFGQVNIRAVLVNHPFDTDKK